MKRATGILAVVLVLVVLGVRHWRRSGRETVRKSGVEQSGSGKVIPSVPGSARKSESLRQGGDDEARDLPRPEPGFAGDDRAHADRSDATVSSGDTVSPESASAPPSPPDAAPAGAALPMAEGAERVAMADPRGTGSRRMDAPSVSASVESAGPAAVDAAVAEGGAGEAPIESAADGAVASQPVTPVEIVESATLKTLLPASAPGLKLTGASDSKASLMGMTVSKALATYEGNDGALVDVQIVDLGGLGDAAAMTQIGLVGSDIDVQSASGYERTVTISGHRGFEAYDTNVRAGHIELMVDNRYKVEVNGQNIDAAFLKTLIESIPLDQLRSLGQ